MKKAKKKKDYGSYFMICIIACLLFVLFYFLTRHELNYIQFLRKCKKNDLTIIDVSKQFHDDNAVKKAFIAESKDYWQIEFYQFESKKDAKKKYNNIKEEYPLLKSNSKYAVQNNRLTYSEYSVVTDQRYVHVCRIGKTILYASVPIEYKEDAEKLINKLGY